MAKTLRSREISSVLTGSLLGLLFGLACTGVFPTKVKDILANPRQYDGKTVVIAGRGKRKRKSSFHEILHGEGRHRGNYGHYQPGGSPVRREGASKGSGESSLFAGRPLPSRSRRERRR